MDERPEAATKRTDPHDLVVDKTGWPPGAWHDEPDRIQWKTAAGLPGLLVRHRRLGHLCGYAAVPAGHPAYGSGYDAVDVQVHGGLTYADRCEADGPICHVPEPGQPDDVWWLGFDCAHAGDRSPGQEAIMRGLELPNLPPWYVEGYRDVAYVRGEVEQLAHQLVAMERSRG